MQVQVLSDGDEQELTMLANWLEESDEGGEFPLTRVTTSTGTTMGTLEVVSVVVSNLAAVGSFVLAFDAWRASRPSGSATPRMRVNGRAFEVSGMTAEEIVDVLSAWHELPEASHPTDPAERQHDDEDE